MCPLYPFHIVVLYLCLVLPLLLAVVQGAEEISSSFLNKNPLSAALKNARLVFQPDKLNTQEKNESEIQVSCYNCHFSEFENLKLFLELENPDIARFSGSEDDNYKELVLDITDKGLDKHSNWSMQFNVSGEFLGFTKVIGKVVKKPLDDKKDEVIVENYLPVSVRRKKTIQSKLFSYSVAILVSLAYINMGCAMDLEVVRRTVKRPIGPVIGFISQYLAMPLISFALGFIFVGGKLVAPMRLGLFVTGCSPGGGASNIWTVMFNGNLDLSVTMTAVSTFAAFFMMPAWIFSMGQHLILDDENYPIVIPYYKICIYAFFLVVPLSIGLLLKRFCPKASNFLVKILKPMSLFLILFILTFGIWANLYIFRLMTWQVLLAGMGLPWIGFAFGCSLARALRQPREDVIAIAIETGIQNTGMAIFIMWFTLDHPLGDIAAVVPVAAATMTPFPLLAFLCFRKIVEWKAKKNVGKVIDDDGDEMEVVEKNVVDEKHKNIWIIRDMKESESIQKLMNRVDKESVNLEPES